MSDDLLDHRKPVSAAQQAHRENYGRMQKEKFAMSREVRAGRKPIAPLYVDYWKVKPVVRGQMLDCVVVFNDMRRRAVRWIQGQGVVALSGDGPLDPEAKAALKASDSLLLDCWFNGGTASAKRKPMLSDSLDRPTAGAGGKFVDHELPSPTPWKLGMMKPSMADGLLVASLMRQAWFPLAHSMGPQAVTALFDGQNAVEKNKGTPLAISDELRADLVLAFEALSQIDAPLK